MPAPAVVDQSAAANRPPRVNHRTSAGQQIRQCRLAERADLKALKRDRSRQGKPPRRGRLEPEGRVIVWAADDQTKPPAVARDPVKTVSDEPLAEPGALAIRRDDQGAEQQRRHGGADQNRPKS